MFDVGFERRVDTLWHITIGDGSMSCDCWPKHAGSVHVVVAANQVVSSDKDGDACGS